MRKICGETAGQRGATAGSRKERTMLANMQPRDHMSRE